MSRHSAAPDLATKQSAGSAYRARSCDHHDTRNDLLFTMSDITRRRSSREPLSSRESIMRTDTNFISSDELQDPDWWSQTGSNRRPPACKAGALPTELWPRIAAPAKRELVGLGRFELPTSRLSSARSNQLSYRPRAHARCPRYPE